MFSLHKWSLELNYVSLLMSLICQKYFNLISWEYNPVVFWLLLGQKGTTSS